MSTEGIRHAFRDLDLWPLDQTIATLVEANRGAVAAVEAAAPALARAAEGIERRLRGGGRLIYAGAGTSGRIAMQDAAELPPTFGFDRALVLLAGGEAAGRRAREGAEDDRGEATAAVDAAGVGADDALVGVAASGDTPYTIAAVERARQRGAFTVGLANNAASGLLLAADVAVLLDTGAEVLAGSTRLAAGTAQKVALNALSTAVLVRLGGAYHNLMVGMRPVNAKLRRRAASIVAEATGLGTDEAETALARAEYGIREAIVMADGGVGLERARALLAAHAHRVRDALEDARGAR